MKLAEALQERADLNKKISDLNYEKLETRTELEVLKACFWAFVIVLVAVFLGLLMYLS